MRRTIHTLLYLQIVFYEVLSLSVETVTFTQEEAFLRLVGYEGSLKVNISLEFRTFQTQGVILYHKLSSEGYIKIFLSESQISANIHYSQSEPVNLQFNKIMNDGSWHKLEFSLSRSAGILRLDNESLMSTMVREVRTGSYYDVGGGLHEEVGFRGCLRNLIIDGKHRDVETMAGVIQGCSLQDACGCKNGGLCIKDACNCSGTGYSGTICDISLHWTSCRQAQQFREYDYKFSPLNTSSKELIDIDGSGPLSPVHVTCSLEGGKVVTSIGHDNEEPTKVDGFQEPGSFKQKIYYHAPWEFIKQLVDRSAHCVQYLRYDCKESKLLEENNAWWVNSNGERMLDWAGGGHNGSVRGTCACGKDQSCHDPSKRCNCDSQSTSWLSDGGFIADKGVLPVSALYFGDTGTPFDNKEGRFSLGSLECFGGQHRPSKIQELSSAVSLATFPTDLSKIQLEFKTRGQERGFSEIIAVSTSKERGLLSVQLSCDNSIRVNNQTIYTKIRFCNNRWHSLILERSHLGVFIGVDNAEVFQGRLTVPRSVLLSLAGPVKQTFNGALRSVRIDDKEINLQNLVIKGKRVDLCAGPVCHDGGCQQLGEQVLCDCTNTTMQGDFCEMEVGLSFGAGESVSVDIKNQTINLRSLRFSLSSVSRTGTILAGVKNDVTIFSVSVTESRQLSVSFHINRKYTHIVVPSNYRSGELHEIVIEVSTQQLQLMSTTKTSGRRTEVKVRDGEIEKTQVLGNVGEQDLDNIHHLVIGGLSGCISGLLVGGVPIFKQTIQHQTNTQFCDIGGRRGSLSQYYASSYSVEVVTNSLVLGLGVSLLVVLVSLAVLVSIRYVRRQKGGYYTREDEGERVARDPDTAVLRGVTGCKVERRQEWVL